MQYYGLDTTEVPKDAYGAPPPPPPPVAVPGHSSGRRASDGLIGPYQQLSPVQPTRPRHSMPARVGMAGIRAATTQSGFATALDAVQMSAVLYNFVIL